MISPHVTLRSAQDISKSFREVRAFLSLTHPLAFASQSSEQVLVKLLAGNNSYIVASRTLKVGSMQTFMRNRIYALIVNDSVQDLCQE